METLYLRVNFHVRQLQGGKNMSRRTAREHAFTLLFQLDFSEAEEIKEKTELYFKENELIGDSDHLFILLEIEGVLKHKQEIDTIIENISKGWALYRMPKVDLSILRLATYEILFSDEVPDSVAINEAVELAKKFSGDESPAFINGILGKVAEKSY